VLEFPQVLQLLCSNSSSYSMQHLAFDPLRKGARRELSARLMYSMPYGRSAGAAVHSGPSYGHMTAAFVRAAGMHHVSSTVLSANHIVYVRTSSYQYINSMYLTEKGVWFAPCPRQRRPCHPAAGSPSSPPVSTSRRLPGPPKLSTRH
jgi:hypothetical protein